VLLCTVVGTLIAFYLYTIAAPKAVLEVVVSSSVFWAPPELKAEGKSAESRWQDKFDKFFIVTISNNGAAQADNVIVDLPNSGVAEVRSQDEKTVQLAFRDSITLGSIRPNKSKTVYAWTSQYPFSFEKKNIGVTHTQGVGHITVVRETTGLWNAIYQYTPGWFWLPLFILPFLPWLIHWALREKQISEMQKRINALESGEKNIDSSGDKDE
jgi:hypothetical protein